MDIVSDAITGYAIEHTTPPERHLERVAEQTRRATDRPQMMSRPVEARLLEGLVVATGATRVLEIGTFTGYGALALAARLPAHGRVTTIEFDEATAAMARRHIDSSPHAAKVQLLVGDAREIVAGLPGPFDVVYIDAWKADYVAYYEAVVPKLAGRGVIAADNVLWHGQVADPSDDSEQTAGLRAFNDHVQGDARTHNALLTVGDGVMLIWRA